MRSKSPHPENSKTAINKKMYSIFENSLLAREEMTFSTYINDISKRVKVLTLRKIERKTELSGISQCTRAILKSLANKDGITEMELCRDIKYAAATVSVALKKMSYDKMLDIRIDPVDRRQTIIYITDKGREIGEYLDNAYSEIDEIILNGISEEERELLLPLLKRMLVNVLEAQGKNEPTVYKKKTVRIMKARELMERNNQQIVEPKPRQKPVPKSKQKAEALAAQESEKAEETGKKKKASKGKKAQELPPEEIEISTESENTAPNVEEAAPPAPKRGRGRPKKQKAEKDENAQNNED